MDVNDFNFKSGKRKITHQNTYFNEHFGRSDFEKIENDYDLQYAMNYLIKYIEKSGERIVYYGDLPQYFVSDVMEDDIICPYGEDSHSTKRYSMVHKSICRFNACFLLFLKYQNERQTFRIKACLFNGI